MIGKGVDVEHSTITEIERSERKLDMREQSEGGKLKEGSLDIRPRCQTLLKAFEISMPTTKDSTKSLKEEAKTFVMQERISPVDLALRKPYWWSDRRL